MYTHRADQDLEVHAWKGSAARMQRQACRKIGACAVACHSKCEAARPHSQLSGMLMHLRHTVIFQYDAGCNQRYESQVSDTADIGLNVAIT